MAAPVVAVDERHHNSVIEIPYSPTDKAWASAHQKVMEAYPGTRNTLTMVQKIKDQILKGEPAEIGVNN